MVRNWRDMKNEMQTVIARVNAFKGEIQQHTQAKGAQHILGESALQQVKQLKTALRNIDQNWSLYENDAAVNHLFLAHALHMAQHIAEAAANSMRHAYGETIVRWGLNVEWVDECLDYLDTTLWWWLYQTVNYFYNRGVWLESIQYRTKLGNNVEN